MFSEKQSVSLHKNTTRQKNQRMDMTAERYKSLQKVYCTILGILPIISLYGIGKITLSDFGLLICYMLLFFIALRDKKVYINLPSFLIAVYLLFQLLILSVYADQNTDWADALGSSFRLAYQVLLFSLIPTNNRTSRDTLIRVFRMIGASSAIYGVLQFVFGNAFRISLSPYIPGLPISRMGLEEQQLSWINNAGMLVRARAWFSEPSTLSIYLLLALAIELYISRKSNKALAALYIIGIVVSNSSTGTVGLLVILLFYIKNYCEKKRFKIPRSVILGMLVLVPIAAWIVLQSGYVENFINHAFAGGQGLNEQSHFSDIQIVLSEKANFPELLFGRGLHDININGMRMYLPGWIRTYYCLGVIGTALYVVAFFISYRMSSIAGKRIILLFIILNIGTEIMLGQYLILYMAVTEAAYKRETEYDMLDAECKESV